MGERGRVEGMERSVGRSVGCGARGRECSVAHSGGTNDEDAATGLSRKREADGLKTLFIQMNSGHLCPDFIHTQFRSPAPGSPGACGARISPVRADINHTPCRAPRRSPSSS